MSCRREMVCSGGSRSKSTQQFINNFPQYPVKGPEAQLAVGIFGDWSALKNIRLLYDTDMTFIPFLKKKITIVSNLSAIDIISDKPTRQLFEAFKEVKS